MALDRLITTAQTKHNLQISPSLGCSLFRAALPAARRLLDWTVRNLTRIFFTSNENVVSVLNYDAVQGDEGAEGPGIPFHRLTCPRAVPGVSGD